MDGVDIYTISLTNRSIDLNKIIDSDRIVGGIHVNIVNLCIAVQFSNFNYYYTGQLIDIQNAEKGFSFIAIYTSVLHEKMFEL